MSLYKSNLWDRAIFLPHGYNVNNLGKGPLDKTECQMSKASAL